MYDLSDPRYARQLVLRGFGPAAQERLANGRVLIVGAGGLGSPAASYLAAAGVGTISLVDTDVVDVTNLHRQLLYTTPDVGRRKVDVARERREKRPALERRRRAGPKRHQVIGDPHRVEPGVLRGARLL